MSTLDYESLVLIMGGHSAFQLCWAGTQLNIFDNLYKSSLTYDELKEKTKIDDRPFRILITGLMTLKMLEHDGDKLKNANIVNEMLVREVDYNWVDALGWQNYIVYPGQVDFLESLKTNTNIGLRHFPGDADNLYSRISHDPFLEKTFQDSMASLSKSANNILLENIDLNHSNHIMDAGGGNGTNMIAFANKFSHLKCTVFDSESVCRIASDNISKNNLNSRIDIHPGNLFETEFPSGIDTVLLSHMLTIWSKEKNIQLLKKIYDHLPIGGKVIIFNMMGNDNMIGPMTTALGSPYFISIATGEGMLYTWSEVKEFITIAGFKIDNVQTLPKDHGLIVGIK